MINKEVADIIIKLKNADLACREKLLQSGLLNEGYNIAMQKLHNHNADQLDNVINSIGYPTIAKVGQEASVAAWLVIQHAIARPVFMKKCARLLSEAVRQSKADPKHLAYLTDRIATFEGSPQKYGTQFDWDENGQLSPNEFDSLSNVNQRRKSIGLNTLEEQIQIIRGQAKLENHAAPKDLTERKVEYEKWRREVGWIED